MTATHYNGSRGPVPIASMPYTHLKNAHDKLVREQPHRQAEIEAMAARLAELDAEHNGEAAPAPVGHNNPPPDPVGPDTFEMVKAKIDALLSEVRESGLTVIQNQDQANLVDGFRDRFRKAIQAADKARIAENEPFDTGKAAVQEKFATLIADTKTRRGVAVIALESLGTLLTPWLNKIETDNKAAADKAKKAADDLANQALAAKETAAATGDLVSIIDAEQISQVAATALDDARRAGNAKAQAHGGSRATSLRTYKTAVLVDAKEALLHYLKARPDDVRAALQEMARLDVLAGVDTIPGFRIDSERKVA